MRRPFVAGNWKMHGTQTSIATLLNAIKAAVIEGIDTVVFPPYIFIPQVEKLLNNSHIGWGGQNLCAEVSGAYTGEISALMLQEFNCRYVLIGHSERRTLYQEDDAVIAKKFMLARQHNLIPILCVGETLEQREQAQTFAVIEQQLQNLLAMAPNAILFENALIAYEPVWAIGTGKTASSDQAQEVHAMIRQLLARHNATVATNTRIIYGGSVKASNAAQLFAMPDIDGGLIGGASLIAEDFLAICQAAANAVLV